MMRSMFSGVSGLRIHQTKMDVLANNISNVNTVGYKSSRVTFNEVFSQNLSGASGPNSDTGRGGVNAKQIGLGAGLASIDRIMTQGAAQRTDNQYDVMIQGSGFFVVGDGTNKFFTRMGTFDVDPAGNLILAGSGLKVYGWDVDEKGDIAKGLVRPIEITGKKEFAPPKTTTAIEFGGNLDPKLVGSEHTSTMDFYDSIGNTYRINVTFTNNGDGTWDADFERDDAGEIVATINGKSENKITFSDGFDPADPTQPPVFRVEFDSDGNFVQLLDARDSDAPMGSSFPFAIENPIRNGTANVGKDIADDDDPDIGVIDIDFSGLTQFGNYTSNAKVKSYDGQTAGTLSNISIGQSGVITGTYSNGMTKTLGQIPVVRFANPGGLESIGSNLFRETSNSGTFDGVGEEAEMGEEKLQAGTLEMSTVDLASEFTEMITTQRGYQANSRIITTSDEMLQELVNLKR